MMSFSSFSGTAEAGGVFSELFLLVPLLIVPFDLSSDGFLRFLPRNHEN